MNIVKLYDIESASKGIYNELQDEGINCLNVTRIKYIINTDDSLLISLCLFRFCLHVFRRLPLSVCVHNINLVIFLIYFGHSLKAH